MAPLAEEFNVREITGTVYHTRSDLDLTPDKYRHMPAPDAHIIQRDIGWVVIEDSHGP
jgi:hypothetical protein